MNKSLLAGVALVALIAGPAFAADMAVKAPVRMQAFDWSGFYIGANVGGSFGRANTDWIIGGTPAGSTSQSMNGILGGFQVGYNVQAGNWLAGIEADFQGTSEKGTSQALPAFVGATLINTDTVRLPWFGTIRGRIGMVASEHWLLYFTGGAAYSEVTTDATSLTSAGAPGATALGTSGNSNTLHTGWTVGAGAETMLMGNWSAKLEYLYVDLGSTGGSCATVVPGASSATCFTAPALNTPISTSVHVTDSLIRFGLNYRFAPTAAAVAAKY